MQALKAAGQNPTRASIVAAVESSHWTDGPGLTPYAYSSSDHNGFTGVQMVTVGATGTLTTLGPVETTDDTATGAITPSRVPRRPPRQAAYRATDRVSEDRLTQPCRREMGIARFDSRSLIRVLRWRAPIAARGIIRPDASSGSRPAGTAAAQFRAATRAPDAKPLPSARSASTHSRRSPTARTRSSTSCCSRARPGSRSTFRSPRPSPCCLRSSSSRTGRRSTRIRTVAGHSRWRAGISAARRGWSLPVR